jgi:hypothetical protein
MVKFAKLICRLPNAMPKKASHLVREKRLQEYVGEIEPPEGVYSH